MSTISIHERECSLADITERLARIEKLIEVKVPFLMTEEAIIVIKNHIHKHHRVPENFDYLLRTFGACFKGRNIVEITPKEIDSFISFNWGQNAPSTAAKRLGQITLFFNVCIKNLKNRGLQGFDNPCRFTNRIKNVPKAREGFISPEKMAELLNSFKDPAQWLIFAILTTAGLRIGELLKLRPKDIGGKDYRVLTLIQPKSGRDIEFAVIPENLASSLRAHISLNRLEPDKPIFPTTRSVVNKLLNRHSKKLRLNLSPHDLRRWAASFWERKGEIGMMRFVLRHSFVKASSGAVLIDPLASRYISMLSIEEAKDKQDNLMIFTTVADKDTSEIH